MTKTNEAKRLIDEMLSAQTRFAQSWVDNKPLTAEQLRDEHIRDTSRAALIALINSK